MKLPTASIHNPRLNRNLNYSPEERNEQIIKLMKIPGKRGWGLWEGGVLGQITTRKFETPTRWNQKLMEEASLGGNLYLGDRAACDKLVKID